MKVLGIDTSAVVSTCAICETGENPKVIASGSLNTKLTHSQTLVPFMESLLTGANLSLADIDVFAVSAGPGSFTGLRIGVSAIKGMAFAHNKPVKAVSTLHGIAHNFTVTDAIVCAVMDARCNQVYNALFRVQNGIVMRLCDDRAIFIDELKDDLENYNERIILAGDGADLVYGKINHGLIELAPPALKYQSGTGICFASEQYNDISADALMPVYLRLPQAERERLAKEAQNPEERK